MALALGHTTEGPTYLYSDSAAVVAGMANLPSALRHSSTLAGFFEAAKAGAGSCNVLQVRMVAAHQEADSLVGFARALAVGNGAADKYAVQACALHPTLLP